MNKSKKVKINETILQFWEYVKDQPKIIQSKIIEFLEMNGFVRVKLSNLNYVLARTQNNILSFTTEGEASRFIRNYLESNSLFDVYEAFARGLGSYISGSKLSLLKDVELINDRDDKLSSVFFFRNQFCEVGTDGFSVKSYRDLNKKIWENRLIQRDFEIIDDSKSGQFEKFCQNITKGDADRFLGLKSILGYLLHRNKHNGESKAIILYDEMMGLNGQAHGGTGKTLLCQALSHCREVEIFDGKEMKIGSWFKNQRINLTTDILVYDDLNKNISLEGFFPMITSGIEIEKKREQAFFIKSDSTPKILITSNYEVKGPGGSSDERRRHEFELANYYTVDFTPEMEFGNRFFDGGWDDVEWNRFYLFMMSCVQTYLSKGLVKCDYLNLDKVKIENKTCREFVEFAEDFITVDQWQDKRELKMFFEEFYPGLEEVSSHAFTKWLKNYGVQMNLTYEDRSSGGNYLFILRTSKSDVDGK